MNYEQCHSTKMAGMIDELLRNLSLLVPCYLQRKLARPGRDSREIGSVTIEIEGF